MSEKLPEFAPPPRLLGLLPRNAAVGDARYCPNCKRIRQMRPLPTELSYMLGKLQQKPPQANLENCPKCGAPLDSYRYGERWYKPRLIFLAFWGAVAVVFIGVGLLAGSALGVDLNHSIFWSVVLGIGIFGFVLVFVYFWAWLGGLALLRRNLLTDVKLLDGPDTGGRLTVQLAKEFAVAVVLILIAFVLSQVKK